MIKLCDKSRMKWFEFFYFFIVVIYMAQMVPETTRMVGGLSAPWFPFVMPLVLTAIMAIRHRVNFFDRKFLILMAACMVWEIAVTFKMKLFTNGDQSFQFSLFYTLIIAYVHIRSYGKQIVPLFETIIVWLCKISLPFWALSLLSPGTMQSFAEMFPHTSLGHNILYLYNYILPESEHHLRNSGCSWEPGRFAVMILLGMYCNMIRNGIKFKGNKNIFWMIIALGSTMSTTGYATAVMMYIIHLFRESTRMQKFFYTLLMIPGIYIMIGLDFMGDKISEQLNVQEAVDERLSNMDYYNSEFGDDEYAGSLGRFESLYFEWVNIQKQPLTGYGRNPRNSEFSQSVSTSLYLTGGLLSLIGMHGWILGLFFYLLLFISSRRIAKQYHNKTGSLLFVSVLLSSISYILFTIPVFTAFWLYGWLYDKEKEDEQTEEVKPANVKEKAIVLHARRSWWG